jgi:hypothetical protein
MKIFYETDTITPIVQEHITAQQAKQEEGKESKNTYLSTLLFLGIMLFFAGLGYALSDKTLLAVATVLVVLLILVLIQMLIRRKVARMMHTKLNTLQQNISSSATDVNLIEKMAEPFTIPPFQLNVYEQNELPDHAYTLNTKLTKEKNIFNRKPLQIFYFFNFYSSNSLMNKIRGGWQRHGPVYFLGSPQDISLSKFWSMFKIRKIMQKLLLTTPEKLGEAMDNLSPAPLPPKTKGLLSENYFSGAFPTNTFYCTDAIWQQCVVLLFEKTDIAIIDACNYTKERAGLQWEIGQIINHISTEDFVVLINSKTDLIALGESFKNSWKKMGAASPNNRQGPGAVRFIFHQWADHEIGKPERMGILHTMAKQEALSNDKIIAFMLESK